MTDEPDIQGRVNTILESLVCARKQAGLTQAQAAALLKTATSAVSHYESGARGIDLPLFLRLCQIYDVSAVWVMTGSNPDFDPSTWYETVKTVREDLNRDLHKVSRLLASIDYRE